MTSALSAMAGVAGVAKMVQLTDAVGAATGTQEEQGAAWCKELTKTQRMQGFGACVCLGFLLSALSLLMWSKPTSLALLYTMGNIVMLLRWG